jgi:hypothetical protein
MWLCFFKTLKVEFFDIVEGEVIHFLDVAKFGNDKVQDGASDGDTQVMRTGAVDFLFEYGVVLEILFDLLGFGFGLLKCHDQFHIVEDHSLSFG